MNIPLVDLKVNYLFIKKEIDDAIRDVINSSSFIMGRHIENFDKNFANYLNVKRSIGVASGTAALHLALLALDIRKGDEVITTPNTFIATTEAISYCGAKPVFVDVDEHNFNINTELLEKVITKRTKAIIPVHLYGNPCNIGELLKIAEHYNLKVIEDCAQAHGAEFKGKKVGTFGDIAAFSMFPAKILGAYGDAGAVVTNNEKLAEMVCLLRNHGRIEKYEHLIWGYNYRLDALQAAILNIKLKHIISWIEKRRENAELYNKLLSDVVIPPREESYAKHSYYMYVIKTKDRDKLREYLKSKGIETGIHYPLPLHLQPAYKYLGYKKGDFLATEKISNEILSLPMYPELKKEQIIYITENIKEFILKK